MFKIGLTPVAQLSEEERLVYEVIKRYSEMWEGGVPQTKLIELPELKGFEPKQLKTILSKLVKLNLVRRVRVINGGKSYYVLQAIKAVETEGDLIFPEEVLEVPCLTCRYLYNCGVGGAREPSKCPYLTKYLSSSHAKNQATN